MQADQSGSAAILRPGTSPCRLRGRFIYAHPSVRCVRLTTGKLSIGVPLATALSLAGGPHGSALADAHRRICAFLRFGGIPIVGAHELDFFGPIGHPVSPLVARPFYGDSRWRLAMVLAAPVFVLFLVCRRVLGWNFLTSLYSLLVTPPVRLCRFLLFDGLLGAHVDLAEPGGLVWSRSSIVGRSVSQRRE